MGLFGRRASYTDALTLEAVAAVLRNAGFEAAEMDEDNYRPVTEGFVTFTVPVTHEERVGVLWNDNDAWQEDRIHSAKPALEACGEALTAAGYQAEFVADHPEGFLVVWVEGEF